MGLWIVTTYVLIFTAIQLTDGKGLCPNPEEIDPCTCNVVDDSSIIDCGSAKTEIELALIFNKAVMQVTHYAIFNFSNNVHIKSLNRNVFGNVTFGGIILEKTVLEYIGSTTFKNSFETLQFWYVNNNSKITTEAFPFESLDNYTSLNSLHIANCPLSKMPLIASDSLTKLYLIQDEIPSIPDHSFSFLPNLKSVVITQNQIRTLESGTFDSLPNLEIINLIYNNLQKISEGTFAHLDQLVEIRLYGNNLNNIESGMIHNCPNLREVMMFQNSLTRLDLNGELFNQTTFNFGKNQIATLKKGAFSGLRNGNLRLSFNNIKTLDEDWLKLILDGNNFVELDYNPLNCGCDILWLFDQRYVIQSEPPSLLTGRCSDGKSLHELEQQFLDWLSDECYNY